MDPCVALYARSVETLAEIEGMKAENALRERKGQALAYDSTRFFELADQLKEYLQSAAVPAPPNPRVQMYKTLFHSPDPFVDCLVSCRGKHEDLRYTVASMNPDGEWRIVLPDGTVKLNAPVIEWIPLKDLFGP